MKINNDNNKFSFSYEKGESQSFENTQKVIIHSVSYPVKIYESDVTKVTIIDNTKHYGFGVGSENIIEQKDGVLTFRQGKQIGMFSFSVGDIIVKIPKGTVLEYDVNTISGSIDHNAPSKGELTCESISGSIRIRQGGEEVFAKSISGSVRIYQAFETVSAKATSGSMRLVADEKTKQIDSSTTSGSIRVQLEHVKGYEMKYSTISGSVKDTYENLEYNKKGRSTWGDESLCMNLESISGSIKLTDWD